MQLPLTLIFLCIILLLRCTHQSTENSPSVLMHQSLVCINPKWHIHYHFGRGFLPTPPPKTRHEPTEQYERTPIFTVSAYRLMAQITNCSCPLKVSPSYKNTHKPEHRHIWQSASGSNACARIVFSTYWLWTHCSFSMLCEMLYFFLPLSSDNCGKQT